MTISRFERAQVQLLSIMSKEFTRFTRIWIQTIIPPVITTCLYFVIFGNFIGSHMPKIHGYSYIEYIVPGLVMLAVITNSYVNVVSSFFSAKFQRSIEELLVSPTPNLIILIGYLSGGIMRGLGVGAIVGIVAALFTDLHIVHPLFTLIVVLMTAMLFALGGFINAVFAKKFDDISLVPTFVLQPLTYLGGVFYSISLLPPFWQKVSLANPVLHIINAFRFGVLGVSDININIALVIISAVIVILFVIALYLLEKGHGLRS